MKGLFRKAKAELKKIDRVLDSDARPNSPLVHHPSYSSGRQQGYLRGMEHDQPSTITEPTAIDILRYQYHHGTNLGSIYVLERWLYPSMFPDDASGSSELEAIKSWVGKIGIEATKQKFEEHWNNVVTDADIDWLRNEAKCTAIRLPIGYFDLSRPDLLTETPFAPYAQVYASAWSSIRTLISRLRAHSIGTLIDLHALPGGANAAEHSGTNSGTARFFASNQYRDLSIRCCKYIAQEIKDGIDGVVGLQLVNEADWESERMYEWYDECISTISSIDASLPVIISDAWNFRQAVEYSLKKNSAYPSQPTAPVIIDTHYYWAFTDADKAKSPQQIISEVRTKLSELDGREGSVIDRGAVQAIVGEYSCVLTEDSWAKAGNTSRADLVKQLGQAQSQQWQHRAGAAYFWTWKMDWLPGGEWGFVAQTNNGAISTLPTYTIPEASIGPLLEKANHCKDERMYDAVNQHVSYWDHLRANTPYEHWRFENGWKVGYQDAFIFFQGWGTQAVAPGGKIGNTEVWVLKRIRESGFKGNFVWEFEQGVRRGIQDFEAAVGI
ncbi:glycoside hydrolase family 5 protein [Melanomma pulvis-pyrius CBS 109.77]|uniref:Glycoside hydrolase family 5 protein n=1 Tax=Melanomma pulvis-pyrius CBS 109.77 TaxID=1314802 RepID=A0A6A6WRK2_9PLEO|nr:glycoside hydrolase family 5 protein [Melanomma pulvis-pyrius CBS 109.77]